MSTRAEIEQEMDQSQNSGSDASSFTQRFVDGPLCRCNRGTVISKAWTDENPGRRFYRCQVHGFVSWADKEKQNGWQKVSLLEARDEIRRLKEKTRELRGGNQQSLSVAAVDSTIGSSDFWKKHEEEKTKLENEVMASKEREQLLRQFIVLSWGGFIIVTAMILKMAGN